MQTKFNQGPNNALEVRTMPVTQTAKKCVKTYLSQCLPKAFLDRHEISLTVFPKMRSLGLDMYPVLRTFEITVRVNRKLYSACNQHKRMVMYFSLFPSLKDKALGVYETLAPEWEQLFIDFQQVSKWLKDLVASVNARDQKAPISEQVIKYYKHLNVGDENFGLVLPYVLLTVITTDEQGKLLCEAKERAILAQLLQSPVLSNENRELILFLTERTLQEKLRTFLPC